MVGNQKATQLEQALVPELLVSCVDSLDMPGNWKKPDAVELRGEKPVGVEAVGEKPAGVEAGVLVRGLG